MYRSKVTTDPTRNAIHWAARAVSILFLAVFALMFMKQGIDLRETSPRDWLSLFFFPFGASLGMILAWWQEGVGGAITVVSVFMSILVQDPSLGGAYMLACASPGFLFLLSWGLSLSMADPDGNVVQAQRREK